jgi:parvulin-like peptidyl-prolyl isomerase
MTPIIQIGSQIITKANIIPLLKQYGILPQLVQETIVESAISGISLSQEEITQIYKQFYQQQQLNSDADLEAWLQARGLDRQQLDYQVTRNVKLETFKKTTWGDKLQSYFVQRKTKLDRVVYSLIRVKDICIAQELYFRIQEGEQSFGELAREYSEGPEAQTGGILGPVELGVPHPALAKMLSSIQPGQLLPPTPLGDWIAIVRLEKFLPAQLDEQTKQRLLNELYENWLQTQLKECMQNIKEDFSDIQNGSTGVESLDGASRPISSDASNIR